MAAGTGGVQSPFFVPLVAISSFPRGSLQSLVFVALCHRLLQSTDRPATEKAVLVTRMHQHRGDSIKALAVLLDKPENHTSDAALASVVTLMMAEVNLPSFYHVPLATKELTGRAYLRSSARTRLTGNIMSTGQPLLSRYVEV